MPAELLSAGDPRWSAFIEGGSHDFYHLPGYVDLCARHEGGEAAAFWAEAGGAAMLVPMVLRPLPADLEEGRGLDSVAPYGYPGPLLRGDPGPEAVAALLERLREVGAGAGIVSAFMRFHPLLALPEAPFRRFGDLVHQGDTVYLDLALSHDELGRQTRANHLADARRLDREGYRVVVDRWDLLDDFIRIYEQTMDYRAAGAYYHFGRDYYDELRRCLGQRLHLSVVLAPDGAPAAGGLFTRVEGIVQFHLSGTSDAHRRAGPAKLMLIHMRDWAKEGGDRILHLGGGVGCRDDSLAFFKQGFSKLRSRFHTFRMVLDPVRYARLARMRGVDPDAPGFFPAYRRPCLPEPAGLLERP